MKEKSKESAEKKQEGTKDPKQCSKKCPMRDPVQALKTTLIVSGVILAVAGAVFAVTKKMREK